MSSSTPQNQTIFQAFEWHTQSTPPSSHETHSITSHYSRLTRLLPALSELGITSIWLPPGCKANNPEGNGYDIYDLWDLGEFEQKVVRSTKWGSREELTDLFSKAEECGVDVIWDAVINHKTAGDRTDEAWAVEVDKEDRRYEICPPKKIEAWLRYDFPGRQHEGMKYSKMKWRAEHFNGTDWDQRSQKHEIYKLIDDPSTLTKPFIQPQRKPRTSAPPPRFQGSLSVLRKFRRGGTDKQVEREVKKPARRPGKGWADDVDEEHGNNDYLLFSNIDYTHPEVRVDIRNWGEWMVNDIGVRGVRLDAVQHFSSAFTKEWIIHVNDVFKRKYNDPDKAVFVVGEVWSGEVQRILKWLDAVQHPSGSPQVHAYDSPLVYNFSRISEDVRTRSKNLDLRTILRDSLLKIRPEAAVTLVTNHDTQPGQACYTPMLRELKILFYAFILLRKEGLPCVFWGDLFGTEGPHAEPPVGLIDNNSSQHNTLLPMLVKCRKHFAYGEQTDYRDSATCIAWTRSGTADQPGCGVVLSVAPVAAAGTSTTHLKSSPPAVKKMQVGNPGEVWIDVLGHVRDEVEIDRGGFGGFPHHGIGASVFVQKGVRGFAGVSSEVETRLYNR